MLMCLSCLLPRVLSSQRKLIAINQLSEEIVFVDTFDSVGPQT